ncbi:unnamed protein product, partial [Schistocephalus solidus]|uniref:RRM domain-containing protein n=1 Tax=Schistocephalus solidus TaxID=70667 RepID=A0A183SAS5_SCHSO
RADDDLSQSDDDRPSDNASDLASHQPTIFVGHLKQEVTNFELKTYFSQFGRVSKAEVVHDWATGESRGYGFVTFADNKAFKGGVLKVCHFLHGCRLNVQLSINRFLSRVIPGRPPIQLKPSDLYEYFSKFGISTEVTLMKDRMKWDSRRCGFVIFRDTDAVKKVLETQPHMINATQVTVSSVWNRQSDDTG